MSLRIILENLRFSLNLEFIKVGQQEVYDYLKMYPKKWFTSKQISKGLKVSIGSVTSCLKKLRQSRSVQFKNSQNRNQYEYKFKR